VDVTITATKQTATGKLVSIQPGGHRGYRRRVVSFPIVRLAVDAAGREPRPA